MQDGTALVADFGIALAVSNAGGHRLTQTGLSRFGHSRLGLRLLRGHWGDWARAYAEFDAVELSFASPAGLSGGPVTPVTDYSMAMGLVTENITSSTYLPTITEHREGERIHSEHIHSVIITQ